MIAKLGILDLPILSFDHTFTNNLVIPAGGTVNSGNISNVTLTEGILSTVQILVLPALDVFDTDVTFGCVSFLILGNLMGSSHLNLSL